MIYVGPIRKFDTTYSGLQGKLVICIATWKSSGTPIAQTDVIYYYSYDMLFAYD